MWFDAGRVVDQITMPLGNLNPEDAPRLGGLLKPLCGNNNLSDCKALIYLFKKNVTQQEHAFFCLLQAVHLKTILLDY